MSSCHAEESIVHLFTLHKNHSSYAISENLVKLTHNDHLTGLTQTGQKVKVTFVVSDYHWLLQEMFVHFCIFIDFHAIITIGHETILIIIILLWN